METRTPIETWNMFRRRDEAELWCAVPTETAVPRFLFSGDWDYGGQHPKTMPLSGFRDGVARHSVRMNGFYLFHRIDPVALRSAEV